MLRSLSLLVFVLVCTAVSSQSLTIPAGTGYAVPGENGVEMFSGKGLQYWSDTRQQIQYFFYTRKAGELSVGLTARNAEAPGSKVKLVLDGKEFLVSIPYGKAFKKLLVGTLSIKDTGFHQLSLSAVKKGGNTIADIASVELSGTAAEALHFNPQPRRNAASVHLRYPVADSINVSAFYNEITVPAGADIIHSYYMACGFTRGYFGIQVNGPAERRVIFSVWDAGTESMDRNKVADSNKVQLLAKGENVYADGFGNEGTGGHSHWVYPWKAGTTYKMMVTALPDSASQTTIYTGYFFLPDEQKWKLIASFRAPRDGKYLRGLYSFSENFDGVNGQMQRKAFLGSQWVQRSNGQWKEITQSSFSYDATGKAGDRIDYGGGVADGRFYVWNGGFQKPGAVFGQVFNRDTGSPRPVIDWTKNIDSLTQAQKDRQMIKQAVAARQIDTTGSVDGVYYYIVREGTGEKFTANDTVTIHYKGWLLKDGTVFDQTRDKPAIFPLKRLIRGWQIGVPVVRVGGKVRLYIPSALAYMIRSRSKDIPPNSVLVFDIEVLAAAKSSG